MEQASTNRHEVTRLLSRLAPGAPAAAAERAAAARELLPLLYDELRGLAGRQFRGQPADHTLQPTVLVHEAFLRLVGKADGAGGVGGQPFNDRVHFCAVAATAMRQILVDHARARDAQKRGGGRRAVLLEGNAVSAGDAGAGRALDVLAVHEALGRLAAVDERKHKIVELRFFAGLTVPEVAEVMNLSVSTVEADWRAARAWLAVELGG